MRFCWLVIFKKGKNNKMEEQGCYWTWEIIETRVSGSHQAFTLLLIPASLLVHSVFSLCRMIFFKWKDTWLWQLLNWTSYRLNPSAEAALKLSLSPSLAKERTYWSILNGSLGQSMRPKGGLLELVHFSGWTCKVGPGNGSMKDTQVFIAVITMRTRGRGEGCF